MKTYVAAGMFAMGLLLSSGSPADAQGAVVAEQFEAKATVETIDQASRMALLRGEDGRLVTVTVGPEVRNLAQVKPGDRIVMRIRLGVLAEMAPPDGAGGPTGEADVVARAPAGAKPSGFAGGAMRVRVTFNGYDRNTRTVAYTLPSGQQRKAVLQTEPMRDFAAGLKAGEKVDVTFMRSVAVSVLPAK